MLWIGLTGGIGSGKSAVAAGFQHYQVPVIDADAIARELTAPNGAALAPIKALWGDDLFHPDHTLNRSHLRDMVFTHPHEKHKLEALLHPLIFQNIQAQKHIHTSPHGYGLIEIPLLAEQPQFQSLIHRILLVDAPDSIRITRVQKRNGLDEAAVRAIMAQQSNREARLALADDIIDNSLHWQHLDEQIARLHRFYQDLSHSQP